MTSLGHCSRLGVVRWERGQKSHNRNQDQTCQSDLFLLTTLKWKGSDTLAAFKQDKSLLVQLTYIEDSNIRPLTICFLLSFKFGIAGKLMTDEYDCQP